MTLQVLCRYFAKAVCVRPSHVAIVEDGHSWKFSKWKYKATPKFAFSYFEFFFKKSVLERLSPPAVLQAESVGSLSKWLYYVLLPKGTEVEGQRCCYCSRPSSLKIHHPVIMPGRTYRLSVESSQLQTVYSCLIAFLNLRLQLSLRENGCRILASFAWDCKIFLETVVTVKLVVNWIYFWKKLAWYFDLCRCRELASTPSFTF